MKNKKKVLAIILIFIILLFANCGQIGQIKVYIQKNKIIKKISYNPYMDYNLKIGDTIYVSHKNNDSLKAVVVKINYKKKFCNL